MIILCLTLLLMILLNNSPVFLFCKNILKIIICVGYGELAEEAISSNKPSSSIKKQLKFLFLSSRFISLSAGFILEKNTFSISFLIFLNKESFSL